MFTIIIIPILLALSFVINAGLGISVLRANPRATTNRLFITFAFAIALWNLSLFLTIVGAPAQLIWSRLAFSFGVIMFWALFCFAVLFPGEKRLSRKFILLTTIPSLLVFIGTLTPYMVKSVAVVNGYITGDLGPVLMIFTIFILIMMVITFGTLLRKLFASRGVTRVQLIYINLGVGFFVITFLTTNLILPVFFNIFNFNNLGPVFSFPMNIAIAYAIIRYHLMDIGILIRRGTVFTLLFGVIAFVFISGISFLNRFFPSPFAEILAALIVTALFVPLQKMLESVTDKIFFRKRYRFESAVRELNLLLLKNYKMEGLLEDLLNYLTNTFKIETGAILLEEPSGKYVSRCFIGLNRKNLILENGDPIVQYLKSEIQDHGAHKKEILDRSELGAELQKAALPLSQKERAGIVVQRLEDLNFALTVPIFSSKGRLIAIMFLGAKKSQYPFSAQDEELLDVVLHETAFSIENSLNIERILELDEAKSEFVRVVSHQLRTPLSVARWNIELALDRSAGAIRNKKLKETILNAYEGLTRMNDGLNNIITTLEITEGGVVVQKRSVDFIEEIIVPIEKEFAQKIKNKRMTLEIQTETPSLILEADPNKIHYVMRVLLINAITYGNPKTPIAINITKNEREFRVAVENQGLSIPPENRENIFGKFWRGDQARVMSPDGLGLSLYNSRSFIEAHGGKLWIENKENDSRKPGARFVFTLPTSNDEES